MYKPIEHFKPMYICLCMYVHSVYTRILMKTSACVVKMQIKLAL